MSDIRCSPSRKVSVAIRKAKSPCLCLIVKNKASSLTSIESQFFTMKSV
jgi:hypothetical protein